MLSVPIFIASIVTKLSTKINWRATNKIEIINSKHIHCLAHQLNLVVESCEITFLNYSIVVSDESSKELTN